MSRFLFPASLPGPSGAAVTPVERRLLSDLPGVQSVRGLQRDYLARQAVEWDLLSATQAATLHAFWRDTLLQGGAWFSATWPLPVGWVNAVRRFIGTPRWQHLPGGFWRVSAECELQGRGKAPRDCFVGWWELDENDATQVYLDSSGRGNHLILPGATTTASISQAEGVGRSARIANASGGGYAVGLVNAKSTVFDLRGESFAVGGWFRQPSAGNPSYDQRVIGRIFTDSTTSSFHACWALQRAVASNTWRAAASYNGSTVTIASATVADPTVAHFVVAGFDRLARKLTCWVNVSKGEATIPTPAFFDADTDFTLGVPRRRSDDLLDPSPSLLSGVTLNFDRCFVYRGAMTDDLVAHLYNGGAGRTYATA